MSFLPAPWRWKFISSDSDKGECVFCKALSQDDKESLICFRGEHFFIILNKYPYNSAHIMIVPYMHVNSPDKIPCKELTEMNELMVRSIGILKKCFKPQGFNIGMNIGEAAGAGVKEHCHLHIVPRWAGDSNFMATVGGTRVMSYSIEDVYDILKSEFSDNK